MENGGGFIFDFRVVRINDMMLGNIKCGVRFKLRLLEVFDFSCWLVFF